jgi:uncharacterized protein with GYD domain
MPKYVLLTNLTDDGAKTIKEKPERIAEVDREMEALGVKVLMQLAVLGKYDFVNIVEAADNITIAKASLELARRGTLRIHTMPAIELEEFIASLK